jgi:hypothetical protein
VFPAAWLACSILALVFAAQAKSDIRQGKISPAAWRSATAAQTLAIVDLAVGAVLPLVGLLIVFRHQVSEWLSEFIQVMSGS